MAGQNNAIEVVQTSVRGIETKGEETPTSLPELIRGG